MTLAERLRAGTPEERAAAIASIVAGDSPDEDALEALAGCLGHARKSVQRPAAEALATLAAGGRPVRALLLRALAADDARQRWGGVYALARLGPLPAPALSILLDALGADDGDVRWATADMLLRFPDRAAVLSRLRDLIGSGNAAQRKMALYCLRDLGAREPSVEDAIVTALDDEDRNVRLAAVTTLARLALTRDLAANRLLALLVGGDARVGRAAAAALGVLGAASPAVLAGLRAARTDGDPSLRRAAEGALRALGVPEP